MSSSATRALKILALLGSSGEPLGVTELARRAGLPPGTVFRTLDALQRGAFAERYRSSSRYVVGPAAFRLRQNFFARFRLRELALPHLLKIAAASGETTSLVVPIGWHGLRVAVARGGNEITQASPLGTLGPLAGHYAGRALLAHMGDERINAYAAWANTQSNELAAVLAPIQARGFAIDDSRAVPGRSALALPVRLAGDPIASIAIEGPVLDLAHTHGTAAWTTELEALERQVALRPELAANPYAHLDPTLVTLDGGT